MGSRPVGGTLSGPCHRVCYPVYMCVSIRCVCASVVRVYVPDPCSRLDCVILDLIVISYLRFYRFADL